MPFVAVVFEENSSGIVEIDVAPSIWIDYKKETCGWPASDDEKLVASLVRDQIPLGSLGVSYNEYKYTRISKEKARRGEACEKRDKYMKDIDGDTTAPPLPGKRVRKVATWYDPYDEATTAARRVGHNSQNFSKYDAHDEVTTGESIRDRIKSSAGSQPPKFHKNVKKRKQSHDDDKDTDYVHPGKSTTKSRAAPSTRSSSSRGETDRAVAKKKNSRTKSLSSTKGQNKKDDNLMSDNEHNYYDHSDVEILNDATDNLSSEQAMKKMTNTEKKILTRNTLARYVKAIPPSTPKSDVAGLSSSVNHLSALEKLSSNTTLNYSDLSDCSSQSRLILGNTAAPSSVVPLSTKSFALPEQNLVVVGSQPKPFQLISGAINNVQETVNNLISGFNNLAIAVKEIAEVLTDLNTKTAVHAVTLDELVEGNKKILQLVTDTTFFNRPPPSISFPITNKDALMQLEEDLLHPDLKYTKQKELRCTIIGCTRKTVSLTVRCILAHLIDRNFAVNVSWAGKKDNVVAFKTLKGILDMIRERCLLSHGGEEVKICTDRKKRSYKMLTCSNEVVDGIIIHWLNRAKTRLKSSAARGKKDKKNPSDTVRTEGEEGDEDDDEDEDDITYADEVDDEQNEVEPLTTIHDENNVEIETTNPLDMDDEFLKELNMELE